MANPETTRPAKPVRAHSAENPPPPLSVKPGGVPLPPPAEDREGWALWERIVFRYLCLHWLLYALPAPLSSLLSTLTWNLGNLQEHAAEQEWFEADLTGWAQPVNDVFGGVSVWWQSTTTWVSEAAAYLSEDWAFEVIHQATGSGDTTHGYVKLGCIVFFAAVLTAAWTLLAAFLSRWSFFSRRPPGHPRLGRWVHLGARWYLALILLSYGAAKFFGGQFIEPSISGLTREIGDHSPMGMVWTFMGISAPYKYLSGIGEIAGFALLLHRRTALMGCFVTCAVMANVCALNWMYAVPVKLFSTHLLLIAVFLMAPYRHRLWALFVSNQPSEPVDIRVVRTRWIGWPLAIIGWLWAVGVVWQTYETRSERWEQMQTGMLAKPELYGLWKVEQMILDGEQVSMSDSSRWEFLAVDRGNRAWAKTLLGSVSSFEIEEDLEAGQVTMTPRGSEEGTAWTVERSTVTRKVRNPVPRTMEDWQHPVDGEREQVVWRGKWQDKELELHTVKKVFRVHDGFRFIRELPR